MEKQYSGSCNDAIITAYVPVYSAALLSLLPTLSGRKQLFVSNIPKIRKQSQWQSQLQ